MMSVVGYGGGMPSEKYRERFDLNLDPYQDDESVGKETIHSGHFMVSDINDSAAQEEDETPSLVVHESDCDQDNSPSNMDLKDFVFDTECKETSKTYTFGGPQCTHTISIDASLTKLFECMSLAYSGKITSPRWKQFKGLKLRLKDKIRLNNIIWRAWHIQFVAKRKPLVCQFASPLDVDVHYKPEALLLEGKYWKRQAASVTAEYKKWRMYYKGRSKSSHGGDTDMMDLDWDFRFSTWSNSSLQDDDIYMDFTDTLFSTYNQSYEPRDIGKSGLADFIQPGLSQLQPALDDFVDTFEPLQDFLLSRLPPLPEEGPAPDFITSRNQLASMFNLVNTQAPSFSNNSANPVLPSGSENNPSVSSSSTGSTSPYLSPSSPPALIPSPSVPQAQESQSALLNAKTFTSSSSSVFPILLTTPKSSIPSSLEQSLSLTSSLIASPSLPVNRPPPGPSLFAFQTNSKVPDSSATKSYPMASVLTAQGNLLPRVSTLLHSTLAQVPMLKSQPVVSKPQRKVAIKQSLSKIDEPLLSKHSTNTKPYSTFQTKTPGGGEFAVLGLPKEDLPRQNSPTTVPAKTRRTGKQMDSPGNRRHSYTQGQPGLGEKGTQKPLANIAVNIVPNDATTLQTDSQFAVPKAQAKPRLRSRSMSSPQNSKTQQLVLTSKPAQAVSLTDINMLTSSPLLAVTTQSSISPILSGTAQLTAGAAQQLSAARISPAGSVSSSAVLAQLLATGSTFNPDLSASNMAPTVISTSTNSTTPTVTIISSVPASSNTLVISPLTLAAAAAAVRTVPSEGDMQKPVVMSSLRPIFTNSITPRVSLISPSKVEPATASSPPPVSSLSPQGASSSLSSLPSTSTSPGPTAETASTHAKAFRPKSDEERVQYKEHRRVCHINAEQKRRCNIKHGFEALHTLLPSLCQNPNSKVSKAAMLQKAVDHIKTLKSERQHQLEEMDLLKSQIESLNQTINLYQSQLPATGAPVPCQRNNQLKEMFDEHIKARTLQNWKYWVFSLIMEPLLDSYSNSVNTSSMDELCSSLLAWLDKNCSLVALRPVVLNSLRQLSTKTNILNQPAHLPEEATRAVTKKEDR